ncbi:unnamed protein product, partial [Chrysoparadoxa australica]
AARAEASRAEDPVWATEPAYRQELLQSWRGQLKEYAEYRLKALVSEIQSTLKGIDEIEREINLHVLRRASIIGATTTGIAKNQELLTSLGAKELIVEEAGEVLEAHMLTLLNEETERLTLIGDHQQLRPRTNVHELTYESKKGYNLDLSLFERLVIQNKAPWCTLSTQRRMRPSISALIRGEKGYKELLDHVSVSNYPESIPGVVKTLYWVDHNEEEDNADKDLERSKSNSFEAKMVTRFAEYLVKQSCFEAKDITILTPYLGQLIAVRDALNALG